ncbi:hypothetical protein S40285_07132 [Stachybotrys chlorohalonatus IBT 40285]|uniref:Uncharacterized protein n=1 Tax=Stachybotrys chlorohalonatus (strain IBT 40285) TaxID=1283841 RepID=A0A084QL54_STAC4|nr:hypothetical protein S40285_07132 [Stachybotrys chlorohalonata IBT 40285]
MGVDSRRPPPLPAPTETDTTTPTELTATNVSKLPDEKSSFSLPEDGTPVTIRTRGHQANRSQTSLLIEYFEGGKSGSSTDRKPSVRVRLTPSKKGKGDHIQVTETKGSRKASVTRRIPLDQALGSQEIELPGPDDVESMNSYASQTEESNVSRNPIDIEIDRSHRRRRPASPLIPSNVSYQPADASEISAIPADSFLDGSGPSTDIKRSSSPSRGKHLAAAAGAGALTAAAADQISNIKSRSSSKSADQKYKERSDRKRRPKSRTSAVNEYATEEHRSPRKRSGRGPQESAVSAADSSVLSSNPTASQRSADAHSVRSSTSINNPKLLETVEDAIRRLILPELSALKREQSKRESRRGSITSTGTSVSRDDLSIDRRRSSGHRTGSIRDGSKHSEKRNREARHDYDDFSVHSESRESLEGDYLGPDGEVDTPRRSNHLLKAAAAGAAGATLAKGMSSAMDDSVQTEDRKQRERRRRRTESARSRSLGREKYAEEFDEEESIPAPPMPLMSDINPSELTRTSILSADTDRPHSASEELAPVRDVPRGLGTSSADLQQTLGTRHANISHGDLNQLPRGQEFAQEYEPDEFGRKIPIEQYDDYEESRSANSQVDYPEGGYDNGYYSTQDVPPPLKYVPYQAGARGLSPIPSVSGYTEGGSEIQQPRNSIGMQSVLSEAYSTEKSPERLTHNRSVPSLLSGPSNMRSREFDQFSADGRSQRSSGIDYRNSTYTEGSAGPPVRGIGANPDFVHPAFGVESHVASLVDGSMLEQSVLTSGSGYDYAGPQDSNVSYDDRYVAQSSRGQSPEKMSVDSRHDVVEDRHSTPGARSYDEAHEVSEYEVDEHGQKVPRSEYRQSPRTAEEVITKGALAALMRAKQGREQGSVEQASEVDFEPAGVSRNKSFKERTLDGQEPRNTPAHSIDRFEYDDQPKMSASGMPDLNNPMPEVGYDYVDDDMLTNPSVVNERLDGHAEGDELGRATPTQRSMGNYSREDVVDREASVKGSGLGITETAAAAAIGAATGMAAMHSRQASQDQDEWQRTSSERKRDTLVTNPYEDASPIVNPTLNDNLLGARGLDSSFNPPYHTGSPGLVHKYDEGYISNGPNRTPDVQPSKGKGVELLDSADVGEDPFYVPQGHGRHLSGMSQGMASPFYDAATGTGIDRIENKDIVALMQHLMVRDAQRSARDTEIVALLMNAAIEMRNSFREMKDLIQDTGDDVIFANVENTEKLQKAINGPRPFPGTATRSINSSSHAGTIDDMNAKKKNLWRRALQGLSAKGTNDLSRIEDMLMQLLGEVDVLKTQTARPGSIGVAGRSFENLQPEGHYEQDKGYEPEGNSTASHASQSGHLSLQQPSRLATEHKFSDNRISTVEEHEDEYAYDNRTPIVEQPVHHALSNPAIDEIQRGGSVPLNTPPPAFASPQQQPMSAENTPRTDKGKKHKSSSSSGWIPRISRWSETTASSVGKAFRTSGRKDSKYDDFHAQSRSGSSLAMHEAEYQHDPYNEDKLHTGFSEPNLAQPEQSVEPAGAPSGTYMTPEDPKYRAHRNSLNLQHPRPMPGQMERFRNALEDSAQEYNTPMTPKSAEWAGSATSLHRLPQNTNRYSGTSSTAQREPEQWASSPTQQAGPPIPPKELIDSPGSQTPPKSNRLSKLQKNSPLNQQGYESGYGSSQYGGSPRLENRNLNAALGVPARRPSGPRAMTPKSPEEDAAREERRRKRDTFGTSISQDSETF